MAGPRPTRLQPPVDPDRDHILGRRHAEITLVEYGSYTCPYCHAAHAVIAAIRERLGTRMSYIFRHLPITGKGAEEAAALAEYAATAAAKFWPVHDTLMKLSLIHI